MIHQEESHFVNQVLGEPEGNQRIEVTKNEIVLIHSLLDCEFVILKLGIGVLVFCKAVIFDGLKLLSLVFVIGLFLVVGDEVLLQFFYVVVLEWKDLLLVGRELFLL